MSASAEILCSRCGTPFPTERGKNVVTCVVCGQLRPDLDMTLDDDDDDDLAGAMGAGAAGAALKASSQTTSVEEDRPRQTNHLVQDEPAAAATEIFRLDRPYVAMSDETPGAAAHHRAVGSTDSLMERLGPVLLIVAPLVTGMAGALNMLQVVPDFSKGSWYAVGTVFVALLLAALFGGIIVSGFFYLARIRWTLLLRLIFLGVAVAVGHYGVRDLPSHIQPRPDDLPAVLVRLH